MNSVEEIGIDQLNLVRRAVMALMQVCSISCVLDSEYCSLIGVQSGSGFDEASGADTKISEIRRGFRGALSQRVVVVRMKGSSEKDGGTGWRG